MASGTHDSFFCPIFLILLFPNLFLWISLYSPCDYLVSVSFFSSFHLFLSFSSITLPPTIQIPQCSNYAWIIYMLLHIPCISSLHMFYNHCCNYTSVSLLTTVEFYPIVIHPTDTPNSCCPNIFFFNYAHIFQVVHTLTIILPCCPNYSFRVPRFNVPTSVANFWLHYALSTPVVAARNNYMSRSNIQELLLLLT